MVYRNITEGRFLRRPNRFVAYVDIGGREEVCHVKNTGRCRELLRENARVFLEKSENPDRKTAYDLVAVYKGDRLINMDSAAPNQVMREYLSSRFRDALIRPETRNGNSRFDFYMENGAEKTWIEVKGVTLEENGAVLFPDAPTDRGLKHVRELIRLREEGFGAWLAFVVQMDKVNYFTPNNRTDPAFGKALCQAEKAGVKLSALICRVKPDSLTIKGEIPIRL